MDACRSGKLGAAHRGRRGSRIGKNSGPLKDQQKVSGKPSRRLPENTTGDLSAHFQGHISASTRRGLLLSTLSAPHRFQRNKGARGLSNQPLEGVRRDIDAAIRRWTTDQNPVPPKGRSSAKVPGGPSSCRDRVTAASKATGAPLPTPDKGRFPATSTRLNAGTDGTSKRQAPSSVGRARAMPWAFSARMTRKNRGTIATSSGPSSPTMPPTTSASSG